VTTKGPVPSPAEVARRIALAGPTRQAAPVPTTEQTAPPIAIPSEPVASTIATAVHPAVVQWWSALAGYGVVDLSDGTTSFTHVTSLPGDGFKCLVRGEHVSVKVAPNPTKPGLTTLEVAYPPSRHAGEVSAYDPHRGHGLIVDDATGDEVFVHYSHVLHPAGVRASLRMKEKVTFDLEPGTHRVEASAVKQLDPREGLDRYCRVSRDDLARLADMAEPETWDFHTPVVDDEEDPGNQETVPGSPTYPVLRSYIQHTVARLEEQGKVAFGNGQHAPVAALNTGLVTPSQEPIYAYLVKRQASDGFDWRLDAWVKESDGRLAGVFSPRPSRATYWDEPTVLFFDTRLPLILDWDHFVEDNLVRYPPDIQDKAMALMLTRAAVAAARERVGRNYKAAVPQFHRGEVQLLLPLCLRGTAEAQLALVVRRIGNEYHGETVLPLPGALRNARLLARPDRDWLNP